LVSLGILFFAKSQVAGDYIRVSGVAIMTTAQDQDEGLSRELSVFSCSVTKVVGPFPRVFPPGTETGNVPAANIEGKKIFYGLSAVVVVDKGMSRADRDRARAAVSAH